MKRQRFVIAFVLFAVLSGGLYGVAAGRAADKESALTSDMFPRPLTEPVPAEPLDGMIVKGTGTPVVADEGVTEGARQYSSQPGNEQIAPEVLAAQEEFAGAAMEVEEAHPDLFVHAKINEASDKAEADFLLQLTSAPTPDITRVLSKISGDTEIRFGGTPLNSDTQSTASGAALKALRASDAVLPGTGLAGLNEARSGIRVTFALQRELNDEELAALHGAVTQAVREATGLPDLGVEFVEIPPVPSELNAAVIGGRFLHDGSVPSCTAGFTAVRNGQRGLVTARHCRPNNLTYRGVAGIIQYVTDATPYQGNVVDLEFYRTLSPHTTDARFQRRNANELYTVTNRVNPVQNQTVCLNGIVTRFICDKVSLDTNICYDTDSWPGVPLVTICRVVRTNNWIGDSGDSGGPWFNGNTAFGIHSGGAWSGSLFTRIGAVSTFLDANLIMQ